MPGKDQIGGKSSLSVFRAILWALVVLFLVFYLYKFYRYLFVNSNLTEYLQSENLFHYPGSYIRRSLLGNLFILFPQAWWTYVIRIFYMLLVSFIIGYMIRKSQEVYSLALFLYMPFGLRIVVLDSNGLYRKELVFYPALMLIMAIFGRKRGRYVNLLFAIAIGAVMTMLHESFLFLGVPVCIWIMHLSGEGRREILTYCVSMIILWLALSPDITASQLDAMDRFFSGYGLDWSKSRFYLSKDREQMFVFSVSYFVKGPILFFLGLLIPFLIYLRIIRVLTGELSILLMVQLVAALFLCLLGVDYGRWFTFAVTSWFIVIFHYSGMEGLTEWLGRSGSNRTLFIVSLFAMLCYHVPVNMTYLDADYTLKENFILMHLRKYFLENGL